MTKLRNAKQQAQKVRRSNPRWMLVWTSGHIEHATAPTAIAAAEQRASKNTSLATTRPEGEATAVTFVLPNGRRAAEVFIYPVPKTWPLSTPVAGFDHRFRRAA